MSYGYRDNNDDNYDDEDDDDDSDDDDDNTMIMMKIRFRFLFTRNSKRYCDRHHKRAAGQRSLSSLTLHQ